MLKNEKERLNKTQLLDNLRRRFLSTLNHTAWSDWRKKAKLCYDYRDGNQWSSADLARLAERKQPPIVNNQIKMMVDYEIGIYLSQRTRTVYRGRNTPADDQSHQTLTALKLFIEQNSQYEFQERDMVEDGTITGFGCIDIRPGYNPETKQIEIQMESIDVFEMYPDPFSRKYDWNQDAQFLSRERWVELGDAILMWPEKKMQLNEVVSAHGDGSITGITDTDRDPWNRDTFQWIDSQRNRIRLIEQQWKEKEAVICIRMADGTVSEVTAVPKKQITEFMLQNPGTEVFQEVRDILHIAIFTDNILLEHKRDPFKGAGMFGSPMFTYIPYWVIRKKNGEPYSFVATILPLQDSINKRESKALHLLNTNQAIIEQGNIVDELELAEEMAKPDGIIKVKDISQLRIEKNTDLAVTQMNFHQQAVVAIRQVSGKNPDALGEKSPIRSGIGIQRKQQGTATMVSPQFDNLRRTKVIQAKLILDYISRYYTGAMVFRITDDPTMGEFAAQTYAVNMMDPGTGQIANVGEYAYDVVAEEQPSATSLHQTHFQVLAQVLPSLAQLPPQYAMLLVEASDMKHKDKLLQMLQQAAQAMQQQQPKPQMSMNMQWDKLSEEDKNYFRQQMGAPPSQEGNPLMAMMGG